MTADEMDRVRAARAILVDGRGAKDEDAELMAFFAIFEPDHPMAPQSKADAREMQS